MLSPSAPGGLVLELRHAPQLAHVRDGVEEPHELAVRGHMALHEDDRPFRVHPARQEQVDQVDGVAPELGADLAHGDRVQVDRAVHAVVGLLHRDPVLDGAEIVAQVQRPRRLDAAEDARAAGWSVCLFAHGSGVYPSEPGPATGRARQRAARQGGAAPTLRRAESRCYSAGEPRMPGGWSRESPQLEGACGRRRGKEGAGCAAETLRPTERDGTGPWSGGPRPRRTG